MVKKYLKATFENRCNGCEMCVFEAQRQLGQIGLTNSPIRILRDATNSNLYFHVEIDDSLDNLKVEEVLKICPTGVFEILEIEDESLIS
jgi:hypothetical protein